MSRTSKLRRLMLYNPSTLFLTKVIHWSYGTPIGNVLADTSVNAGRNRLEAFTRSRSEWCISRQRSWGVPIPMLFDVKTGTPNMDDSVLSHIVAVLAEKGIDHWWRGAVEDFLPPSMQNTSSSYYKGTDTMDVWFDSGVSWTGIEELLQAEGLGTRTPLTEAYLEGSDQHRGWFQSSLLTSIAVKGVAPFANVITHGFVLDKDGVKMSKSIGNVISPLTVINGGDVSWRFHLRCWAVLLMMLRPSRTRRSCPRTAQMYCGSGRLPPDIPEMSLARWTPYQGRQKLCERSGIHCASSLVTCPTPRQKREVYLQV